MVGMSSLHEGKVIEMTEGMSADKLFVSGLPPTTTEETLRAYFETFGPLASIRLIYNQGEGHIKFRRTSLSGLSGSFDPDQKTSHLLKRIKT